jgi:hypothetical protein
VEQGTRGGVSLILLAIHSAGQAQGWEDNHQTGFLCRNTLSEFSIHVHRSLWGFVTVGFRWVASFKPLVASIFHQSLNLFRLLLCSFGHVSNCPTRLFKNFDCRLLF